MKDKHFVIWLKGFVTACHSHLPTPAQWDQLVEKLNTVKSEGDKQYTRKEYNYSSFARSFRLPDNVKDDAITAKYENGVLQLALPKSNVQITATKEIKVA